MPGAGPAQQTGAGFEEGKSKPASVGSQPLSFRPALSDSHPKLSALGWDSLWSLSAELFKMAEGILVMTTGLTILPRTPMLTIHP